MDYFGVISKAVEKIEKDLKKDIDIESLAEEVFVSPFHFHRIFKAFTDYPVISYLRKRRLNEAYRELMETDRTVLEIGMDYSYYSNEAFTRAIKKETGFTPSKLRKMEKIDVGLEKLPIWEMKYKKKYAEEELEYEIVEIPEFLLMGISREMTLEDDKNYDVVWKMKLKLIEDKIKLDFVVKDIESEFGIAFGGDRDFKNPYANKFIYFRGYVVDGKTLLKGYDFKKIKGFKCAKFYVGTSQEEHQKYLDYIYGCWLMKNDYELDREQFDFMEEIVEAEGKERQIYFYIPLK